MQAHFRVPATSANLGPGFDCLGLALDLWNETSFSLTGQGLSIEVHGEGQDTLPAEKNNLIIQAAARVYETIAVDFPSDFAIRCSNRIPLSSGLGSSAAAVLTGLMGANTLAGNPLSEMEIFHLAMELEGHPDNISAALYGGLTLSMMDNGSSTIKQLDCHPFDLIVILPEVSLSTQDARDALPKQVDLGDAVFNASHTALTIDALRSGNLPLLRQAMQDRVHQPYRLPLISGAAEALTAAQNCGAAAALSGAGPSVIAFSKGNRDELAEQMQTAFADKGIRSRTFKLTLATSGAEPFPALA